MTGLAALGVALAFAAGAGLQRIAGMGMGLVVAPTLSVLLGPVLGVTMSNAGAVLTALLVLGAMRRDVAWGMFGRIAPLLVLGSLLGAWFVRQADAAALQIVLGASVLIALGFAIASDVRLPVQGAGPAVVAGVVGGFMNTVAGIAGPAMAVFAVATRWEQRSFAATLQPIFLVANVSSLLTKAALGAVPANGGVPWWAWAVAATAILGGVAAAGMLSRVVSASTARGVAMTVALAGAAVALARGLAGLS